MSLLFGALQIFALDTRMGGLYPEFLKRYLHRILLQKLLMSWAGLSMLIGEFGTMMYFGECDPTNHTIGHGRLTAGTQRLSAG